MLGFCLAAFCTKFIGIRHFFFNKRPMKPSFAVRYFFFFAHSLYVFFFSARVSYHSAVCSSLSIAINHFDTHTTDTHSEFVRLFFRSLIRPIHTCSPIIHMMRTNTCERVHTVRATKRDRTRKIPRNNRFECDYRCRFFFLFLYPSFSFVRSAMQNNFCV